MSTAIFIRTYAHDFPWLRYCLRSIARFASGFSGLHIAVASRDWEQFQQEFAGGLQMPFFTEARACQCYIDDYVGQQITKMQAWQYTDSRNILYVDSDVIFSRPFTPADFLENGKPILWKTPFSVLDGDVLKWQAVTAKALRFIPEFETMRLMPLIHDRLVVERAYHWIGGEDYIVNQPYREFSEFNAIGGYALQFVPNYYAIKDTTKTPIQAAPGRQYWSHTPWTPELEKELEALVNG